MLQDRGLTGIFLTVLVLTGLIGASLWILRPFLGAIIWATMIVVATWGPLRGVEARLGGRRWAAVSVMCLGLLLTLVVPLTAAIGTIVVHVDDIVAGAKHLRELKLPPPPAWLPELPLVGERVVRLWQEVAAGGMQILAVHISPYAAGIASWLVSQLGSLGALFVQLLLTVVAAAVLYANGEQAADAARRFGARLGGERGERAVHLSGQAIRGVARGVVVTALVQAAIGGLGLWIAGVPFAALLTAVMFLLAVAQIGAVPILALATAWLFWSGAAAWGTFLLVVTVVAGVLDNVLRPILIKQGAAELSLLLIFVGVVGGLIAFGLIGIFIGPLVLAVTHTLLDAWLQAGARNPT